MNEHTIKQYITANKKLMLVNKLKEPLAKNWTSDEFSISDDEVLKWKGNVGWIIGVGDLVIDVDPRNGGDVSYAKLLDTYPELKDAVGGLTPSVTTPSGGYHIYLRISDEDVSAGYKYKKTLKAEYPGIDFLTKGAYCVIAGGSTDKGDYLFEDELQDSLPQMTAPKCIIDLITTEFNGVGVGVGVGAVDLGDFNGLINPYTASGSSWSEDKVVAMLDKLDASMANDDWVKIGMALHGWDSSLGLGLWESWSKDGSSWKEGECAKRWKSFDFGGGVTLGTMSHMVKDADYDAADMKIKVYISRIEKASEKDLKFTLIPELKKQVFDRINKEKLVKAIQDQYKSVAGVKIPISTLRQSITKYDNGSSAVGSGRLAVDENGEPVSGVFIEDNADAPDWCKDWIYVNTHVGFVNLKTLKLHKSESFNVENGKYIPVNETGSKPSASKYVSDNGFVDKVDAMAYLPTHCSRVCELEGGLRVLNSFNPATVPVAASEFTDEGLEAIERVKRHIRFICGNNKDADILTQWIAHNVQMPGVKLLWSPVIQSIQGVGKTFFGELLKTCLGEDNVGVVSPSQVTSNHNAWATGVAVTVLEEIRVSGQNRYEVVNSLKPLITDKTIMINPKGVDSYRIRNTTNYICFTNFKDAIPMGIDDRRWWIKCVEINSLDQMEEITGEPSSVYFPLLFDTVRSLGGELRKWLLDYVLTEEFLAIKQAPMTDCKMSMIASEEVCFDGLSEVKELLDEGHKYYNLECVSSSDLFEQLTFKYPDLEVGNRMKNIILKKLGYMPLPKLIKIDGWPRRIWTKNFMTNEKVRMKFLG